MSSNKFSDLSDSLLSRTLANLAILDQIKQGNYNQAKYYTGFGGLRKTFKQSEIIEKLSSLLKPYEYDALYKSSRTGYFTPQLLIDFIYALVQKHGFNQGKILEPACGHGAFFEYMPEAMRSNSDITGIELEPISAAIAKKLYPDIRIIRGGFQNFHQNEFDLIIGNPPYAPFTVFDKEHQDLKNEYIHHYFVAKSVRLLKENGLLAMIVPCYLLDNQINHLRSQIAEVADLVTAYRMPDCLFVDAKITVDVVIFQRKAYPKSDWSSISLIDLPGNKRFYMADYFVKNPNHILGELNTYETHSTYDDTKRIGLRCKGTLEDVKNRLPALLDSVKPLVP